MSARASIILLGLLLLSLSPFITIASADETTESFTIYTDKEEYLLGEIVEIYVKAEAIDPGQNITVTDVIVYDPNNITIAEWHNTTIVLTDTTNPKYVGRVIATSEGKYTVHAKATGCPWFLWALWFFLCWWWEKTHVIPEIPYGTLAASASMILAVITYAAASKRRK